VVGVRSSVTRERDANPFLDGRDTMKRLLGVSIGLGLSLAIASAAHAGGVRVGIYLGGPPVVVPAPPVVVVPAPPPVVYYPPPVVAYPPPYVIAPARPYYVTRPVYGHWHGHRHWRHGHWRHH
jgi:hypothetical protein